MTDHRDEYPWHDWHIELKGLEERLMGRLNDVLIEQRRTNGRVLEAEKDLIRHDGRILALMDLATELKGTTERVVQLVGERRTDILHVDSDRQPVTYWDFKLVWKTLGIVSAILGCAIAALWALFDRILPAIIRLFKTP